jgi:hypothetical protein
MDQSEARATLRVLVSVALADGRLDIDEKRLLDVVAHYEYEDDDPPPSRFESSQELDRALVQIHSEEGKRIAWNGALAIACVDEGCSPQEHALLVRIHAKLLPDEPFPEIAAAEEKYNQAFEGIREEVAEATAAFLHRVGDGAKTGKLPPRDYDKLASELAKAKRELYARALAIPPPR